MPVTEAAATVAGDYRAHFEAVCAAEEALDALIRTGSLGATRVVTGELTATARAVPPFRVLCERLDRGHALRAAADALEDCLRDAGTAATIVERNGLAQLEALRELAECNQDRAAADRRIVLIALSVSHCNAASAGFVARQLASGRLSEQDRRVRIFRAAQDDPLYEPALAACAELTRQIAAVAERTGADVMGLTHQVWFGWPATVSQRLPTSD